MKKHLSRVTVLKIIALAAENAFIYCGVIILRVLLFANDGGIAGLFFYALAAALGHLAGKMFLKNIPAFVSGMASKKPVKFLAFMLGIRDGARFISSAAAWSGILLPLVFNFAIYAQYGISRTVFELPVAAAAYIISLKQSKLAYHQIMSNNASYAGFFFLGVYLELAYFISGLSYLKPWFFAVAYYFVLTYLIVKNQEDIEINIFSKKHIEKSILPANMRRFNTMAICAVFLVILLLFNLKAVVIYILNMMGKIIALVVRGVIWAMAMVLPDAAGQLGGGSPQNPALFEFGTRQTSPAANLIFNTLKNFTILYLTYRVLLYIIRRFPAFMRAAAERIKKLFSVREGETAADAREFVDESEIIKPARGHSRDSDIKKRARKIRKELKYIKDPVERVRHMYSCLLRMLMLRGIRIDPGDTTMDIIGKACPVEGVRDGLEPFTAIYNQVRYGDVVPDAEMMAEAECAFGRTVKAIGGRQERNAFPE